ncbi:hypothetical protein NLO88_15150 [Pseudomonas syringae]|nr:hypothetical protein [Pseudomonas syringae]
MGVDMKLESQWMRNIECVLSEAKEKYSIIEYSKVEGDQFLKFPELGFYFQAAEDGLITAFRIFFTDLDGYFPASMETRGDYADLKSVIDITKAMGEPLKEIPSIRIPSLAPTCPGLQYLRGDRFVSFYYDERSGVIRFVHVRHNAHSL